MSKSILSVHHALAFAALAFAPFAASAAEPALDRLVSGEAALVFSLDDVPRLRAQFPTTPFGRAYADPDVARFIAPLFKNPDYLKFIGQLQEETGYTPSELLAFATGDILVTVPVSSLKGGGAGEEPSADIFIALEVGENDAKLRELIGQQQARRATEKPDAAPATTEDYNGAVIHLIAEEAQAEKKSGKPLVWTLHQGRWFISSSRDLVAGALDAAAAGGLSQSLATSPAYRAVLDRPGARSDYAMLLDFKAIYPVFIAGIEASRDPNSAPNPMGIDPVNIVKALGLDVLGSLSASGGLAPDGSTVGDLALTYTEERGLVKLLAYRDGPVAKPDWVPASWINVSTQNFSISDLYAEIEATLDRISPMLAGMAMGQIRAFDRQLNIDIKRDFIGNFGPILLSGIALPAGATAANPPPYDEMDQFFAVSLADAAVFERTIEAVKARFLPPQGGPLEKRDYLGRTLHVFTPPAGSPPETRGFGYAITDGWLFVGVGSPASLEAVIQRLNKPDAATSFWARPDVRAALESVPASSSTIQFSDLASMVASFCTLAVKAQAARGEEQPAFVDASAVPAAEVFARHFTYVINHGERRPDGFYFHTFMPAASAR